MNPTWVCDVVDDSKRKCYVVSNAYFIYLSVFEVLDNTQLSQYIRLFVAYFLIQRSLLYMKRIVGSVYDVQSS